MGCQAGVSDGYHIITADGYGYPLPLTLRPNHLLAPLHPTVYGYPLGRRQVRTDDYLHDAVPLRLSGIITATSETRLHEFAAEIRGFVRRAAWLQRSDRAITRLLAGSDIELVPTDGCANEATLTVVLVQVERIWRNPDGVEVTG